MDSLSFIATKYLITAAIVVVVSEVAKHYSKLGALIAALPTVTILILIWLHLESQPEQRLADHMRFTFWYVIPTLPMFLLFPIMLSRFGFWLALGGSAIVTLICFGLLTLIAKNFGVQLI